MDSSSSFSSSRSYSVPNTVVASSKRDPDKDLYILLDPDKFPAPHLANIEEDYPMFMPPLKSFPAPETPLEPMEFLSRSWSISSVDVARSLQSKSQHSLGSLRTLEAGPQHTSLEDPTLGAPFTFASTLTSQMVMDRLMAPGPSLEASPFVSRRNSCSSGPLAFLSPPMSPRTVEDYKFRRSFSRVKAPLSGRSMGRWIKDLKTKKKEATRCQNAQVHAAVSVAGVAAAIAAVTAATAACAQEDSSSKTSMAVASAAALVAAQCVEVAESMGADRDHMASVVSSAVNVRSAGDIMTLTAAAATSLRGAATLRARRMKEARSLAAVTPYERATSCPSISFSGHDTENEESEAEYNCHDLLARGAEFLKRSKNGDLQWRNVFIYLNKVGQVTVRLQSKHMRGALTKNKKSTIFQVFSDIRAWSGRNILEGSENRRYFALRTSSGDMEFECRNKEEHQVWTEGISRLLYISSQYRRSTNFTVNAVERYNLNQEYSYFETSLLWRDNAASVNDMLYKGYRTRATLRSRLANTNLRLRQQKARQV